MWQSKGAGADFALWRGVRKSREQLGKGRALKAAFQEVVTAKGPDCSTAQNCMGLGCILIGRNKVAGISS
eukprot:3915364-Lingulodinium_polyedra.AAC.1